MLGNLSFPLSFDPLFFLLATPNSLWDLSSPTRNQTQAPGRHWKCWVLITETPENSLTLYFLLSLILNDWYWGGGASFNFFRLNLHTVIYIDLKSTICWVFTNILPCTPLTRYWKHIVNTPENPLVPFLSQKQPRLWVFSPLISFMEWLVFWTPEQMKYLVVQAACSHTSEHQSRKETKGGSQQALGTLTHGSASLLIFWASASLTKSW